MSWTARHLIMDSPHDATPSSEGVLSTPLSPRTRDIFATLTTLYDEVPSTDTHSIEHNKTPNTIYARGEPPSIWCLWPHSGSDDTPRAQPQLIEGTQMPRKRKTMTSEHLNTKTASKRKGEPAMICFDAATGWEASPRKRAAFAGHRKAELNQVRSIGACLRCQIRKVRVSSCKSHWHDRKLILRSALAKIHAESVSRSHNLK